VSDAAGRYARGVRKVSGVGLGDAIGCCVPDEVTNRRPEKDRQPTPAEVATHAASPSWSLFGSPEVDESHGEAGGPERVDLLPPGAAAPGYRPCPWPCS